MYYRNVLSKIKNNSVLIKKNKVYKLNEKYQRYWIEDCLDEIKDKDFIEFMKKNKMIKESGPSSKICKKDLITTLHLQITDACMCRCGHCYVSGRENTFLAFGDFKCIVDDFVDAGMVSLDYTGGEPTLHPEFMEFIKYGKAQGLHQMLFTNGYIPEYLYSAIIENLDVVQVSLDGNELYHNNFRRNKQIYQHVIKTLDALYRQDVELVLSMSITEANVSQIEHVVDISHKYGALFRMAPPVPVGNFAIDDNDYYKRLLSQVMEECNKLGVYPQELVPRSPHCGAIHSSLYMDVNKNIYPCPLLSGTKWNMGIFDNSICEVLDSDRTCKIAEKINSYMKKEGKYVFFCPALYDGVKMKDENEYFGRVKEEYL